MLPTTLTKASLIDSNLGHLFATGKELRSHLLAQGYKQAELCELVSLPLAERLTRRVLPKGLSFVDGTRLSEDTEVPVTVSEQPLVLKFFQGKGSGKAKITLRVHLYARLSLKDVEALLPTEQAESQVTSKEDTKALEEYTMLDNLGIFDK